MDQCPEGWGFAVGSRLVVAVGGIAEGAVLAGRIAVGDRAAEDVVGGGAAVHIGDWVVVRIGVDCIAVVGHIVAGCIAVVDCTGADADIAAAG